jgi:hypothetical protein
MSKKLKRSTDQLFHGLVTEGADGCSALRVAYFDVTDQGVSFLRRNGEEIEVLPFSAMRVRKSSCGRKGTAFQGKAEFPILYVNNYDSVEAIRRRAPARVQQQLFAMMPRQRSLSDSLRLVAGGIVMVVTMLWAIPLT